jgi:hypothetical protein
VAVSLFLSARNTHAQQGVIERLNIDRLQLVSLGPSVGRIQPSQVEATTIYGLTADYGEIGPGWRVEFGVSLWSSRYKDHVIRTFLDSLRSSLSDPAGLTELRESRISVYDVTLGWGLRRYLRPSATFNPTLTVGLAAHVINAEGKLIKGTFVERALDDIAVGAYGEVGLQRRFLRRLEVEVVARGDLLSSYRSVQLRAGTSYYFGEPRRPAGQENRQ